MNNEPVAWWDGKEPNVLGLAYHQNDYCHFPLYTHPVKEFNDGGEPVKNATYWKRQHDNLLMKLNTCAVKVSELEKKLDTRTKELIGASFYEHDYKTLMANNEPVAWMLETKRGNISCFVKPSDEFNWIPLYTHPAKTEDEPNWKEMYWWMHELNHKHWSELDALKTHPANTLTDEEIEDLADKYLSVNYKYGEDIYVLGEVEFARAILRKAQEK